jgi:hypothetical protein
VPAANGHRVDHVFFVPRQNNAYRYLAVIRGVGRIYSPAAVIESNFTAHGREQICL